ncbi:hypothetical protein ASPBRDRAFT_199026 [Aspergillus brasiliensis CBS 101740]|uniref:Uncharacterized protein n=1 Tax=Aspergillus brasiliensis (strain CBS 101740 / IMI 381727 / IBT 21946) TaxID=767769 RepID=A0A1L9UA92_ASPBC|nr:hypothetical protein ASPBRDRAFT_199026 [Aspergillus brasiliensis CBS 101740]
MVTFNLSYTAPINRPNHHPTLTPSLVWKCIDRKVRHAEQFVPAIVKTELLSESATELKRRVNFAPNGHPAGATEAIETCRLYEPCRVEFVAADGSSIINAVSRGSSDDENDLYYTYIFEWRHPDLVEGSVEALAQWERDWKTTQLAVEATIDTMRRLVAEGVVS